MLKMTNLIKNVGWVFYNNLSLLILILIALILLVSIFRSVSLAVKNFDTFEEEIRTFDSIKEINLQLQRDLVFVKSEDFKLTLLRKVYNYTNDSSNILEIKTEPVFLEKEKEYYKMVPNNLIEDLKKKLYFP
ncbi:hypothetical protein D6810_01790 [Candidatus Dojkabacteria bacterium]|uniref:Uncharacterized protein n=1 Tax=Candidatus Dojkabacteria bacterium TaxID=2099670 RepID=A0A3M0YYF7_9BACT|nr:MAG: hypothetical protein D6810_01790 [Candidatus Dojkabacteria bacterium]